jgi:hypothetical protein
MLDRVSSDGRNSGCLAGQFTRRTKMLVAYHNDPKIKAAILAQLMWWALA